MLRPLPSTRTNPPQKVSELIVSTMASWDKQKLQLFFTPMDVEVIRNIPLNMRRQQDFWAWHYERRGFFSVRSAYRMLVNDKQRTRAWLEDRSGTSDTRATEKEWLAIWKVNVPAKIRVFLWRLARHSLSSGDVLHHRNMATHNSCGITGEPDS